MPFRTGSESTVPPPLRARSNTHKPLNANYQTAKPPNKQLRRAELKERMLQRVEGELEELRAALEEAGACTPHPSRLVD